ncbi:MAG: DUF3363 domain-containing protein [Sphingomonas sp.]|uniref:DUF3363 domain-containing protein n=1 Tax=Sphingomonas sp. TaxID=28214 RepID=UPI0026012F29|nr:DUF3363 domain-containing protein [Sphingomonas sp.]MBX3566317.1 DUF3363 domain-containing protein [Sphingomonas sp.]
MLAYFHSWEYEKTPKRKGGRVYIEVRASGEVAFHEGYLSRKEAQALAKRGEDSSDTKPQRPELTSTLQTYVDLHRHAALRAALCSAPGVAFRLMIAHAVCGSSLWRVEPEPQASRNEAVSASIAASLGEAAFDARRRAALDLLGMDEERGNVVRRFGDQDSLPAIFLRLTLLPDALKSLERREIQTVAQALARDLGKPFRDAVAGDVVEGRLVRQVDLNSGRFALVENAREFALVPWRDVLARRVGQQVPGIVRGDGVNWRFGRGRSGPEIG